MPLALRPSTLRSTHRYIRANSTVLIHDSAPPMFYDRYKLYMRGVAPFYQVEWTRGSLSCLRPRPHALAFGPDVHLKHLIHALQWDAR